MAAGLCEIRYTNLRKQKVEGRQEEEEGLQSRGWNYEQS